MKISIIIATRNRSDALETISLPFLVKQDFKDFEILIWDESDDDKSKVVVAKFIQFHPDMMIRYFKEPRVRLASQRNDAAKVARENIIFFIDNDTEVSPDGLSALNETFEDKSVFGVDLKLKSLRNKNFEANWKDFFRRLYGAYSVIFRMGHSDNKRIVMLSGWNIWPYIDEKFSKKVEWLTGCSMSFKQETKTAQQFEWKNYRRSLKKPNGLNIRTGFSL